MVDRMTSKIFHNHNLTVTLHCYSTIKTIKDQKPHNSFISITSIRRKLVLRLHLHQTIVS